ncbi:MAG: DUF262 domain-containing HNH endonuclease family protein [Oscillospiraceae bacterium]|nr:DUF262 domain-containing HNH endonuclease family protein [Oscillospiraceae bacterium]
MSIHRVNQYPVSSLFNPEGKIVFEIPKYQREYTWGTGQLENLFDDLVENSPGYFLGTIICIDTSIEAIDAPKREVVDGQQRLTTLSLLLAALYTELSKYRGTMNEDQQADLLQLKRKLVLKGTESALRVVPQTQNHNLDDYKGVLAEQKIISPHRMPPFAGNRRIKRAFEYFKKRIAAEIMEAQTNDSPEAAVAILTNLLDKVGAATIVMIEVSNHADAYTLFESLNNRGTPLTAVDLIKNLLLAQLDLHGNESLDYYFSQWQQVLEYIGDDYAVQERFFRHNYNAFRRSVNAPFSRGDDSRRYPLGTLATRSTLLSIYEKVIKRDPKLFLDTLIANAALYSKIILQSSDGLNADLKENYQNLSRVQGAPAYLLLLFFEKEREDLALSEADLVKTVKLLVNFFVRRNLTDTPPTRDLTRIFMSLIEEIETKGLTASEVYQAVRDRILSCSASDAAFEEKLRGPVYTDNYDATRFMLCMLAAKGMTVENKVDLWHTTANHLHTWTVEHIFPQGENIPQCWIDMIADGNAAKAREYQAQYVHTLGNLTITGYNSTLGNRAFEDKRERKDSEGRPNGYRNGLNLNADVVSAETWKVENITARTVRLVQDILALFEL